MLLIFAMKCNKGHLKKAMLKMNRTLITKEPQFNVTVNDQTFLSMKKSLCTPQSFVANSGQTFDQ